MITRVSVLSAWVCFIASLFCVYQFLLQGSPGLMVDSLAEEFSINLKEVGFLSAAFFYPYIILQVPSGLIVDKYGPRKVLLWSSLLLTLSTLAFACSKDCFCADLSRVMMGVASAPGVIACLGLAAICFPDRFAVMAGFIEMMGLLGGALGDLWLEYYIYHHDWRSAMLICTVSGFCIFIAIYLFVKVPVSNKSMSAIEDDYFSVFEHMRQLAALTKNVWIWRSCIYGAFLFAIISAFASLWSIEFLKVYHPENHHLAANSTSLVFMGCAIGAVVSGYLSKKQGMLFIMRIFSLLALVSFLALLFLPVSFQFVSVVLFLLGFAAGAYVLPFEDVKSQVPDNIQNTAMGFTNMLMLLVGGPVLQPLIGSLLDMVSTSHGLVDPLTMVHFRIAFLPIVFGLVIACLLSFMPQRHTLALPVTKLAVN